MAKRPLNILQVSTVDVGGGAEKVAWDLLAEYRARGHDSTLAVGRKRSSDPSVVRIPNEDAPGAWSRFWWRLHYRLQPVYGRWWGTRRCRLTHRLAEPAGAVDAWRGVEDFHYPGTWRLLDLPSRRPDVVHAHNLHARYFDLRALPWLSQQVPVVATLHDAWLLAGHCAHSFDCSRWQTGCGQCPDLTIYPGVRRDATAYNWQRKRDIYAASQLNLATPCRWLMDKVERSMLAPAVGQSRIIPYGIDLSVFQPADKEAVRATLGIAREDHVLLFVAAGVRANIWKDYPTLRAALGRLAERGRDRPLLLLALGETAPPERIGGATMRFVPFQKDPRVVARYYQAADVYVHAARVDTFPLTVLEALACGTSVVASAVGGIPEQVKTFPQLGTNVPDAASEHKPEESTGIVVPPADAEALAAGVERLLDDERLRRALGVSAAADARRRFDLKRQADEYLQWYEELLEAHPSVDRLPSDRAANAHPHRDAKRSTRLPA